MTATATTAPVAVRITRFSRTRWAAAVTFGGQIVAAEGKTRKAAVAGLEPALRAIGYNRDLPTWELLPTEDATAPAPQPEAKPAPEPEAAPAPAAEPKVLSAKDARDDRAEEAVETAKRTVVVPTALPKMAAGWVTPDSDIEAWVDVYRQCVSKLEPVFEADPDKRTRVSNFREGVNLAMEAISFRGAYRRTIGGDFWLRHAQSKLQRERGEYLPDVTTRQTVRGEGNRRARHHRNINGNWDDVSAATARKEAQVAAERKAAIPSAPLTPEITEASRRAKAAQATAPTTTTEETTDMNLNDYVRDDENQTWRHRETGEIPRRAVRKELNRARARAERKAAGPRYTGDKAAMRVAAAYGRQMAGAYAEAGLKGSFGYKVGVVVALRGQEALPHPEYDAFVEAELGADKLAGLVAEFRDEDAKSA
jgi:hypothetical protein